MERKGINFYHIFKIKLFHISQKALFNCLAKSVELNNGDLRAVRLRFLLISTSNSRSVENLMAFLHIHSHH